MQEEIIFFTKYTNLSDFSRSFGIGIGGGARSGGSSGGDVKGSASLSLNYSMQDFEQNTNSVIGNGTIKTGTILNLDSDNNLISVVSGTDYGSESDTFQSGLNRNIQTAQVTTKSLTVNPIEINSGGNINITNNYSQAGGSIFMNATGDINNSNYTIQADENIVMSATNINNISTAASAAIAASNPTKIEAGAMVSLNATNDITNIGATIKGGDLVYLTAGNDINNKALIDYKINGNTATESEAIASSANNIRSTLIAQGNIESGGNIVLVAGNNLNNIGSKITSTGSTLLEATNGDINITTSILRDRTVESGGKKKNSWTRTTDTTTNLGSEITSGGDLYLTSGASDINITGSKLTSTNNTELTAANDVNISSALDSYYSYFSSSKKGFGHSSTSINSKETTTNIQSILTSTAGDISITSGADTTITASNLTAAGEGNISAENLNILNGLDTERTFSQSTRSKVGFSGKDALMAAVMVASVVATGGASLAVIGAAAGGSAAIGGTSSQKNSKTTSTYNETVVASNLTFGEGLNLTSSEDTIIRSSKLTAGTEGVSGAQDLKITANNLHLLTAANSNYSSTSTKEESRYFFKNKDYGNYTTSAVNNELTSGADGNITFDINNQALAQYNANDWTDTNTAAPTSLNYLNLLKDQTLADQLTLSAVGNTNTSWDEKNAGLTKTGQITVAVAGAVATAGAGSFATWGAAAASAGAGTAATIATTSAVNASVNTDGNLLGSLDDVGNQVIEDTTSDDSLKTIAISAAAAGLATKAMQLSKLNDIQVAANASNTQRLATNTAIAGGKIAINTTAYTAANSAINETSITDSLKDQDTTLLVAQLLGEVGAKEIGRAAHGSILTDENGKLLRSSDGTILTTSPTISQAEQLALHGALGCALSAGVGGSCASGALAGATSEYLASESLKNGTTPQSAILIGQTTGAASALLTSTLQGGSDEETAENIGLGGFVGVNAVTNNTLYVSETSKKVIATDGKNNHKVVLLDQAGLEKLYDENLPLFKRLFSDTNSSFITNDNSDFRILKVDANYLNQSGGEIYNLTNKSDFISLASLTGADGMSYSDNLTDMMFGKNSSSFNFNIGDQDMLNIFFQNGMQNNVQGANASGNLIEQKTGQEVGLIINSTDAGKLKTGGDIIEFLPNKLYLKDVLNGEVLQQIATNGNDKNLVIMHSAGNEDVRKAAQVLSLSNVNLGGKVDFMSVGSPVPQKQLQKVLEPIGGNLIGQYNNWKDPVTHHKTWAAGTVGLLAYGIYAGATTGVSMMGQPAVTTGTGLEGLARVVLGGGLGGVAGGGTTLYNLQIQHPFETYFNKDFKGLQTDIVNWKNQNPPKN